MTSRHAADVLIVGAGPAGLALAVALGRRGRFRVVVVDRQHGAGQSVGEALPPGIARPLSHLGIWDEFVADEHLPSAGVTVSWGEATRRDWDYIRSPFHNGWFVDRCHFAKRLARHAIASGCEVKYGTRVARIQQRRDGRWTLEVTDALGSTDRWTTRVLVHAAGRGAAFAHAGYRRARQDSLVAVIQYGRLSALHDWEPRLWLESTSDGWWYSAPLPGKRCVTAYLTDADLLSRDAASSFAAALRQAPMTAQRLESCVGGEPLRVVGASTGRAAKFVGKGFLTVGDAAFTVDPLRGNGILNALNQALRCAGPICDYLRDATINFAAIERELEADYANFLSGLPRYYGMETRWSSLPFWQRRATSDREFSASSRAVVGPMSADSSW